MSEQENMAMVLQAFKNVGLSDNQARILAAEVGRENAFQDKYLWGYHTDDANGKKNIGMISWQGARANGVESALRSAGLIQNGRIVKGQASLDIMAQYIIDEIRSKPEYADTKKIFLDNPNVDYQTGTRVLGKNFIRWAYDNPKYASGHRNRDSFYAKLGGVVPKAGTPTMATPGVGRAADPLAGVDTSGKAALNTAGAPLYVGGPTAADAPFGGELAGGEPLITAYAGQQPAYMSGYKPLADPIDLFAGVGAGAGGVSNDLWGIIGNVNRQQVQSDPSLAMLPIPFV